MYVDLKMHFHKFKITEWKWKDSIQQKKIMRNK